MDRCIFIRVASFSQMVLEKHITNHQHRAFGAGQLTLRFASFQLPVIEALNVGFFSIKLSNTFRFRVESAPRGKLDS